jgi:hypothetical protein
VREESHLDEMRDAIRGDFERLAARRGEQELMRPGEPAVPTESHEQQPLEEPPTEPQAEPQAEPEQLAEHPDEPEAAPATPRRSWLGRMFST